MKQAIVTKYLSPTNRRDVRIKVTAQAGSKTYPWDHENDTEINHENCARAFAAELGWLERNRMVGGHNPDGYGFTFVLIEKKVRSKK